MKSRHSRAFTKIDLLIVMATVAMLTFWGFYGFPFRAQQSTKRVNCTSNLKQAGLVKQAGLAMRMWSNDHQERFPWRVPSSEGGVSDYPGNGTWAAWMAFRAVSNEVNSPKVLNCTLDVGKERANVFIDAPGGTHGVPEDPPGQGLVYFRDLRLSYFLGADADETKPNTILSGDRNVSTNSKMRAGILPVQNASQLRWTKDIHQHKGNIALADGSVSQLSSKNLPKAFRSALDASTNTAVRLIIP
jgi:prepilin-type processing-associated H-X9-DG protein